MEKETIFNFISHYRPALATLFFKPSKIFMNTSG